MNPQQCPDGHPNTKGSRFCTECGVSMVPIPAKNVGWSGLRIAAVGTLLALVVGTVVVSVVVSNDDDEAPVVAVEETPVDPLLAAARDSARTCSEDFVWAITQLGDNGNSGRTTVANEWGTQDGRLDKASQFVSAFVQERSRVGQDPAALLVLQQVNDYCAELYGLEPPSETAP